MAIIGVVQGLVLKSASSIFLRKRCAWPLEKGEP